MESKSCNWVWNGSPSFIPIECEEFNRFDGKYQTFIDKGVDNIHPGPEHNKHYGRVLFDYISMKFPTYLPHKELERKLI